MLPILLLLFIIHFNLSILLHEGRCILIDNKIYYLGGNIQQDKLEINHHIYELDLSNGLKLQDNIAPWKKLDIESPVALQPSIIKISDSNIWMIGGKQVELKQSVKQFDSNLMKWSTLNDNSLSLKKALNSLNINESIYDAKLLQDDNNIYFICGYYNKNNTINQNLNLLTYNIKENNWNPSNFAYQLPSNANYIFKNGKIYMIGGTYNRKDHSSSNTISHIQLNLDSVTNDITTGDIPMNILGHSTILIENQIYLIGGNHNQSKIYSLNLSTMDWNIINIKDFKPTTDACLIHYQDVLIYSFGKIEDKIQPITQIIDLKQNKLIMEYNFKYHFNIILFLTIFIPIISIIILIISSILIYKYIKRRVEIKKMEAPKPLKDLDWCAKDIGNFKIKDIGFDTQITTLDDDISFPVKAEIALGNINPFLKDLSVNYR